MINFSNGVKKFINKLLNIILVVLVIANLISYQFVLPALHARADDSSGAVTTDSTSTDSGSSSSDTSNKTDDKNKTDTTATDTTDKTDTTSTAAIDKTDTTNTTTATTTTSTSATNTITSTPATTPTDTTPATTPSDTPTTTTDTEDNLVTGTANDNAAAGENPIAGQTAPADPADLVAGTGPVVDEGQTAPADSANLIAGTSPAADNVITGGSNSDQPKDNNDNNNGNTGNDNPSSTGEENQAATGQNQATIDTGGAAAQAGAVNTVNTNIVTENGGEVVQNITGSYTGDINLLSAFNSILDKAKDLNDQNKQALENITVTNVNVATDVNNKVVATASSGDNTITGEKGSAAITTGNSQAVASAVNLINTNIVGNTWLFAIINVLGNWTGNLIVPGEGLLKTPTADMIFNKVTNINQADNVQNTVSAEANTGNNSISGSENAKINTGAAVSSASAVNLVNTNITSNNWFFLLINNAGNWTGQVINWINGEQNTAYQYNFGTLDDGYQPTKNVSVYNYNSAENVKNTVIAGADSGNNRISSARNSSIFTGNAGAWASAFNLVNTNITGNNWMFGVVNNAGNWNGNVIFGYPDLAVSLSPNKDKIEPGEDLTYTLTYKNIGQAACDDTELNLFLPQYLSYQSDTNSSGTGDGENRHWSLPGLNPGEEKSFQISAKLESDTPQDITTLETSASASTDTTEKNMSNNSADSDVNVVFPAAKFQVTIEDGAAQTRKNSDLEITRKDDSPVKAGTVASHSITVTNSGKETLYNVLVTEKIKNPSGQSAAEYSWPIAKLKKGQKAVITYQIQMGSDLPPGTYKYSAEALGYTSYGDKIKSSQAESQIELLAVAAGAGAVSGEQVNGGSPALPVEPSADNALSDVLGASSTKADTSWAWLLAAAILLLAYIIEKKKLYRWKVLQKVAQQVSSLLSSFF